MGQQNSIEIGNYLGENGFVLKGENLANKMKNMTCDICEWGLKLYMDDEQTFIESTENDDIYGFEWSTKKIFLYNCSVGSSFKKVRETLFEKGFLLDESGSRKLTKKFIYNNIAIFVSFETEADLAEATYFQINIDTW